MIKIMDYESCLNEILNNRIIEFRRWLDLNYHLEDHNNIIQWVKGNPFEMYHILKDFLEPNRKKITKVQHLFTQGKSKIVIIVGSRGSGKTANALFNAEIINGFRNIYWCGIPSLYLPKWIKPVKDISKVPQGSACFLDETALQYHSRESNKKENIDLSKELTILRHKDISAYYLTQNSYLVDKNIERLADVIIYKPLSSLQYETERESIKNIIIEKMLPKDKTETLMVFHNEDTSKIEYIKFKQPLPHCWTEKISKSFSTNVKN
jgi:hypothetical protein